MLGFETELSAWGQAGSLLCRTLTRACDCLINMPVVKDHSIAGVTISLKNMFGAIHNPNKYHDNGCDPYIADVARHPFIAEKLRLTVLDGVRAQCHGGPAFRSSAVFDLAKVAASTDPVAIDAWAWTTIEHERSRRGMRSLAEAGRPVRHLETAAKHGLGVADPDRLRVVES